VASIGGFVKQVQITVDPNRLRAYDLPLDEVARAIRQSNNEVGAGCWSSPVGSSWSGCTGTPAACRTSSGGGQGRPGRVPVLLKTSPGSSSGRRSGAGSPTSTPGDAVGGIVLMRHGENALNVIAGVRQKLQDLARTPRCPRASRS